MRGAKKMRDEKLYDLMNMLVSTAKSVESYRVQGKFKAMENNEKYIERVKAQLAEYVATGKKPVTFTC